MEEALLYFVIFDLGFIAGFLFKTWLGNRFNYDGYIVVSEEEDRRLYSLELNEYPDELRFKKQVIFRVTTPEESPDRD